MIVYNTDYPDTEMNFILKHAHTPMTVDGAARVLHRADSIVVIEDDIPVNPIPPALQVLVLASNAVIHHPGVFPGVDTEDRLHVDGAGREALLVLRVGTHRAGELVAQLGLRGVGGHVGGLPPGVGGRVGRAGAVGAEDVHHALALKILGKPYKSGSEH